jgi:hypothetical protein
LKLCIGYFRNIEIEINICLVIQQYTSLFVLTTKNYIGGIFVFVTFCQISQIIFLWQQDISKFSVESQQAEQNEL